MLNEYTLSRLRPEDITEDTVREVAISLLRLQVKYGTDYVRAETRRWDATFISDDGTDYVTTAVDAILDLVQLRYEGSVEAMRRWLFGPPLEGSYTDVEGTPWTEGVPYRTVADVDSAEGLHPVLAAYSASITGDE